MAQEPLDPIDVHFVILGALIFFLMMAIFAALGSG
jgi:hypothetical protein